MALKGDLHVGACVYMSAISAKILVMGIVQVLALGLLLFMQPAPCPGSTAGFS